MTRALHAADQVRLEERAEPWGKTGDSALDPARVMARRVQMCAGILEALLRLPWHGGGPVMHRWSRRTLQGLGVQVTVEGTLAPAAPLLLANHLSWIDPLVVLSLQSCLPLAKAEVGAYPVIGPLARWAGLRFVRRECAADRFRALRQVRADLSAGRRVLLFPEGTTTDGTSLAPLHRGGPGLAWRLGIPVQPIRLDSPDPQYPWLGEASLGPHLTARLRAPSTPVRVQLRPVLDPAHHPTRAAWLDAVHAALAPEELHAR